MSTSTYIAGGGDGFTMLTQNIQGRERTYVSLNSLVKARLEDMDQISPQVEGRITLSD